MTYGDKLRDAVRAARDDIELRRRAENYFKEIYFPQMMRAAGYGHDHFCTSISIDTLSLRGIEMLCEYAEEQGIKIDRNTGDMSSPDIRHISFSWEE